MKLSIIIPVYNSKYYLRKCIESVTQQTFADFELLLINDGSTDGSEIICKEFLEKDARIRLINQRNKGASSARNTGLREAKGEYIVFIDSDDFVSKDYLQNFVEHHKSNVNVDLIIHGFSIQDVDRSMKVVQPRSDGNVTINSGKVLKNIPFLCLSSPVSKFFKTAIIIENNLSFNEDIDIGEDLVFVMNYLSRTESVYFSAKSDYFYERRSGSLSTSLKSVDDELLAEELIYDACVNTLKIFGFGEREIEKLMLKELNKHGYRVIFSLYNKGKYIYTRKERLKFIKELKPSQFRRIKRYFAETSYSGKILALFLTKRVIWATDFLLLSLIKNKRS